jgi:hypothetical protein
MENDDSSNHYRVLFKEKLMLGVLDVKTVKRVQSSKLLLPLASTVVLGFNPRQEP